MAFSRPEYWSGWPFPSPGDFLDAGIKITSAALQADSSPLSHHGSLCLWLRIIKSKKLEQDFTGGPMDKNPPANAGNMGLIPDPGRSHMLQHN